METENKYLPQLLAERDSLDASFTHAMKLISEGKRRCFVKTKEKRRMYNFLRYRYIVVLFRETVGIDCNVSRSRDAGRPLQSLASARGG